MEVRVVEPFMRKRDSHQSTLAQVPSGQTAEEKTHECPTMEVCESVNVGSTSS